MKQILKVLLFILLNLAELFVILLSLAIFTSSFPMFSWYEPDSIEFLGIFLLAPIYAVIGGSLVHLGAVLPISKANKLLPFITVGGLALLAFLVADGLNSITSFKLIVFIGISFGCAMFIVTLISAIRDLIGIVKSPPTEEMNKSSI
jgi:hypothetical protein